jgi:alcohol dehydrogenase class IV
MTQNFSLTPGSVNLRFGAGSLDQLVEAIEALGKKSAFIITDQGVAKAGVLKRITDILDGAGIVHGEFADVKPNPTVDLINTAAKAGSDFRDGVIIALGGGSSLDASKGVALVMANPTLFFLPL